MGIQERQLENDLLTLDNAYTTGKVACIGFYNSLEKYDINPNRSVLLSITPDSGTTVIGSLLDAHGAQWFFDIDYMEKAFSMVVRIYGSTKQRPKRHTKLKLEIARKILAEKLSI